MRDENHTIYYVDLDNTVIDSRKRYEAAGAEPDRLVDRSGYDLWLLRVQSQQSLSQDTLLDQMAEKVLLLRDAGNTIVFLTAREEHWREVTQTRLNELGLSQIPLLMRPTGNTQRSGTFKTCVLAAQALKAKQTRLAMVDDDPDGLLAHGCKALGIDFFKVSFEGDRVRCRLLKEAA